MCLEGGVHVAGLLGPELATAIFALLCGIVAAGFAGDVAPWQLAVCTCVSIPAPPFALAGVWTHHDTSPDQRHIANNSDMLHLGPRQCRLSTLPLLPLVRARPPHRRSSLTLSHEQGLPPVRHREALGAPAPWAPHRATGPGPRLPGSNDRDMGLGAQKVT